MLRRIGLCALLIVFISCTIFNSTTISAKTEYKPMIVDTVKVQPDVIELLKEEVRYTKHWEENCHDDTLQLTYKEAQSLMKLAQAEAGTEGAFGQYLVMKVVINRVNDPAFPNTVEEVITQPHQFSTYANGTYQNAEPTLDSHRALALLEKNVGDDDTIVAFETVSNGNSLLRYFDVAWTYLNHTFYTKKH